MLGSKQWVRLVALALAALTGLFLLKTPVLSRIGTDHIVFRLPLSSAVEQVTQALAVESPASEDKQPPPEVIFEIVNTATEETSATQSLFEEVLTPTALAPTSPTASTKLEEPLANYRKAVVMGKLSSEDTDWVGAELADWERAIYVVDLPPGASSPTGLRTKMNKAKEVFPYLTYIIEHYTSFPDVAVFIHSHRSGWPKAWHNDAPGYDAVKMLQQLQLPTVEKRGYVNLRCIHDPGCPKEIELNPPGPPEEVAGAYPVFYADFFNMTVEAVREQVPVVATPCCAQFAVAKTEVLERPKSEYERFLGIIENSHLDDDTLGRVMEYTWHILFGRDAVHCENVATCWMEVYGRSPR